MYSILKSYGYPVADENADYDNSTSAPTADIPDTESSIIGSEEESDYEIES